MAIFHNKGKLFLDKEKHARLLEQVAWESKCSKYSPSASVDILRIIECSLNPAPPTGISISSLRKFHLLRITSVSTGLTRAWMWMDCIIHSSSYFLLMHLPAPVALPVSFKVSPNPSVSGCPGTSYMYWWVIPSAGYHEESSPFWSLACLHPLFLKSLRGPHHCCL